MVVPLGGRLVEHHHALKCKTELHETSLAKIRAEPAGVFEVFVAGEFSIGEALNHAFELFFFKLPRIHGQEGRARSLGQLHKVLPTLGIVPGLPHDGLHFLVVHVSGKAAHAMPFSEGHHVVFQGRKIVGKFRHA